MTAEKPAFGPETSERRKSRTAPLEPGVIGRALLRTAVYAGLIAISILLWWAIGRQLLSD
ncbi:hypothetical protein [Kaistia sp. 32K]|uniref:hypothetical protein n=1 Tax=Kaistia sp. 32K TaxID=2795690 RepID=UPI001915B47F|nr:hypothetical protein [Kaistia sp. 32K]